MYGYGLTIFAPPPPPTWRKHMISPPSLLPLDTCENITFPCTTYVVGKKIMISCLTSSFIGNVVFECQSWLDIFHHRRDILDHLVTLQNFENQFLPNALRRFFSETKPPNDRGSYLQCLVDKFSDRFCQCNPQLGLSKGTLWHLKTCDVRSRCNGNFNLSCKATLDLWP